MNIGNRLKLLREQKNLTQAELGKMIGVTNATVNRYETGEIDIKRTIAIKLANALDVTPSFIMGWTDSPTSKTSPIKETLTGNEKKIVNNYRKLNDLGQSKADEYITDLSENLKYTASDSKSKLADVFDDITKELSRATEENAAHTKQD